MGGGSSVASSLTPMGMAAAAIVCPPAGLAAGAIFGVGVAVGAAWGANKPPTDDASPVLDALHAVDSAAEAVTAYLRAAKGAACSAADWALEKLERAAASLVDRVVALLLRLRGSREAAAAKRDMDRAARAHQQQHACPDVFAEAAARVARSRRRIVDAAAAGGGASALVRRCPGSASDFDAARRAAGSAAEMMVLILEAFVAEAGLGDDIPPAARSFITVIAAAAVVCLDIFVSLTAAD